MLPENISKIPSTAIVTALPKEFAAVRSLFDECHEFSHPNDPNDYVVAVLTDSEGGQHYFPIALLKQMGNNSAAALARDVLRTFQNVRDILMVGIAGGVPHPSEPEKHVRLGDIAVSMQKGVVQFDKIKLESGTPKIRDTSQPPSARLVGFVNRLEADRYAGKTPWEGYEVIALAKLNTSRPNTRSDQLFSTANRSTRIPHPKQVARRRGRPMVHCGLIGSSNTLLKDAAVRDALRSDTGIIAVEMEGSGIADGTWTGGASYLLIRGICDYADQSKNNEWQMYAAIVAASYARCIVDCILSTEEAFVDSTKKNFLRLLDRGEKPPFYGQTTFVPLTLLKRCDNSVFDWNEPSIELENFINSIVIGEQGSGKSSLCTYLFEKASALFRSASTEFFPIYFDLEYTPINRATEKIVALLTSINEQKNPHTDDIKILAFFDSLDQTTNPEKVARYLLGRATNRSPISFIVFSRRIEAASLVGKFLNELVIQPLDNEQIKSVLTTASDGNMSLEQIERLSEQGMVEALRTPFLATIFAKLKQSSMREADCPHDLSLFKMIEDLSEAHLAMTENASANEITDIPILLAKRLNGSKRRQSLRASDSHDASSSPFLYIENEEYRFRHDIFRDYFISKLVAREAGTVRLLTEIYQRREDPNLSFLVFSLSADRASALLSALWPLVRFSCMLSGYFVGMHNPFLYVYIKILVRFKKISARDRRIEDLIELMTRGDDYFSFSFSIPREILGANYDNFRFQNTYFLVGQLQSESYLEHLLSKNIAAIDEFSVIGLLNYRSQRVADFLLEALGDCSGERGAASFRYMGRMYAVAVLVRLPFSMLSGRLHGSVDKGFPEIAAGVLDGVSSVLASRIGKLHCAGAGTVGQASETAKIIRSNGYFEDVTYLMITESEDWIDFFFYCYENADNGLSEKALSCLRNCSRSNSARPDISERLIALCESEDAVVRRRAIHDGLYFSDHGPAQKAFRRHVEKAIKFDDVSIVRLSALNTSWHVFRDVFYKWGPVLLAKESRFPRLSEKTHERFQKFCTDTIVELCLSFDGQEAEKVEACLTAAVNAPNDMMRSWGVEILGDEQPELASRIGEWVILNADEIAEEGHYNFFRVLHNLEVSVSEPVVCKGLRSESMRVLSVAIKCVSENNYSEQVRSELLAARDRVPSGWGHMNDWIDNKVESRGAR